MAKKIKDLQFYQAVGRRKEAVAKVRLYLTNKEKIASVRGHKVKQGEIYVNDKLLNVAYPSIFIQKKIAVPFIITNNENRFATMIYTEGGGKEGQLQAILNGLARAIEQVDKETFRPILKKKGLLKRDARVRERRKVGTGGKARRQKQSPKR